MTSNVSSSLLPAMASLLSDLIRIRSVCGIDPERCVAERICVECERLKLKCDLISAPKQENRPNVIITAGLSQYLLDQQFVLFSISILGNGPSKFLFVGHMDTVDVEDETQWSFPPFAGMIDDQNERMLGRGACDNKGGIVCALYTLYLLQQRIDGEIIIR